MTAMGTACMARIDAWVSRSTWNPISGTMPARSQTSRIRRSCSARFQPRPSSRVYRGAAADQALHQLRRLASESDVAHPPTLRLADRQCLDVTIIVGNLEAAEFAVPAASEQRRMDEIAEGVLAGIE